MNFRRWLFPITHRLIQMEKRIVTQLEDLNAAIVDLQTSTSNQLAAIATEIQQLVTASNSPIDLSGPIAAINELKANIDGSTARLQADDPAPTP